MFKWTKAWNLVRQEMVIIHVLIICLIKLFSKLKKILACCYLGLSSNFGNYHIIRRFSCNLRWGWWFSFTSYDCVSPYIYIYYIKTNNDNLPHKKRIILRENINNIFFFEMKWGTDESATPYVDTIKKVRKVGGRKA